MARVGATLVLLAALAAVALAGSPCDGACSAGLYCDLNCNGGSGSCVAASLCSDPTPANGATCGDGSGFAENFGPNAGQCVASCQPGELADQSTSSTTGQCLDTCPTGSYNDASGNPPSCVDSGSCLGSAVSDPSTYTCVDTTRCYDGTGYADVDDGVCIQHASDCPDTTTHELGDTQFRVCTDPASCISSSTVTTLSSPLYICLHMPLIYSQAAFTSDPYASNIGETSSVYTDGSEVASVKTCVIQIENFGSGYATGYELTSMGGHSYCCRYRGGGASDLTQGTTCSAHKCGAGNTSPAFSVADSNYVLDQNSGICYVDCAINTVSDLPKADLYGGPPPANPPVGPTSVDAPISGLLNAVYVVSDYPAYSPASPMTYFDGSNHVGVACISYGTYTVPTSGPVSGPCTLKDCDGTQVSDYLYDPNSNACYANCYTKS